MNRSAGNAHAPPEGAAASTPHVDLPISMQGRLVVLRPASRHDVSAFYEWRIDKTDIHLWTLKRKIPSPEEFQAEFERSYLTHMTMVVARKSDGVQVGFVQAANMNTEQGWTFFNVNIAPAYRSPGIAAEASYLLLRFLFEDFPIRKIYADVFAYNSVALKLLRRIGFQEEGRSKEHVWYRNQYWDMIRLALYRNQWKLPPEKLEKMLERISRQTDGVGATPAGSSRDSKAANA